MDETVCPMACPECETKGTEKNTNTEFITSNDDVIGVEYYYCSNCGFKWKQHNK